MRLSMTRTVIAVTQVPLPHYELINDLIRPWSGWRRHLLFVASALPRRLFRRRIVIDGADNDALEDRSRCIAAIGSGESLLIYTDDEKTHFDPIRPVDRATMMYD